MTAEVNRRGRLISAWAVRTARAVRRSPVRLEAIPHPREEGRTAPSLGGDGGGARKGAPPSGPARPKVGLEEDGREARDRGPSQSFSASTIFRLLASGELQEGVLQAGAGRPSWALSSEGVPSAITFPSFMMVIRWQTTSAISRTWVLKSTETPSLERRPRISLMIRADLGSRPLVTRPGPGHEAGASGRRRRRPSASSPERSAHHFVDVLGHLQGSQQLSHPLPPIGRGMP